MLAGSAPAPKVSAAVSALQDLFFNAHNSRLIHCGVELQISDTFWSSDKMDRFMGINGHVTKVVRAQFFLVIYDGNGV